MPSFATVALVATVLLVLVMLIAAWVSKPDRRKNGSSPSGDGGMAHTGYGHRQETNDSWSGDGGGDGGGGGD
jgi:hypothetical protein